MNSEPIDELVRRAVLAALAEIDAGTDGATKRSSGPCGDRLANQLHSTIEQALYSYEADVQAARGMLAKRAGE